MNYIKYAFSQYFTWIGYLSAIIGIIAIFPVDKCIAIIVIISCAVLAFIIPFAEAVFRNNFKLKTIGKSNISFTFGNLFKEKCFVLTSNLHFDVNPTGEYISEDSMLGKFVKEYFPNNVEELETCIFDKLTKKYNSCAAPYDYGTFIKISLKGKIIYFLTFTDRIPTAQPDDFYQKSIRSFLKNIVNENHGKTIAVPLFGANNYLSNSGFDSIDKAFKSLMAMISDFEIENQRSEIKLKIVELPKNRAKLINVVRSYSK